MERVPTPPPLTPGETLPRGLEEEGNSEERAQLYYLLHCATVRIMAREAEKKKKESGVAMRAESGTTDLDRGCYGDREVADADCDGQEMTTAGEIEDSDMRDGEDAGGSGGDSTG